MSTLTRRQRTADWLDAKGAHCWVTSLKTMHRPDRPSLRRLDKLLRWLAGVIDPTREDRHVFGNPR